MTAINTGWLQALRILGIIEGTSTLVLFGVAMPLKYLAGRPEAVFWCGSVHGGLFVALVLLALLCLRTVPLPPRLALWVVIGAVVPFGPFVVDRHLARLAGETDPDAS